MPTYDVHFKIKGFFRLDAKTPEDAAERTNVLIDDCIGELESILCTGLKDDNYVFDVVRVDS